MAASAVVEDLDVLEDRVREFDSAASNHPFSYFEPASDDWENDWAEGEWITPDGDYTVHVGPGWAELPLKQELDWRSRWTPHPGTTARPSASRCSRSTDVPRPPGPPAIGGPGGPSTARATA